MQRCAKPVKLIIGGEPQVAPPNAAGAEMLLFCTVVNSRSCSGAALEKIVPPPATLTVIVPKLMHWPVWAGKVCGPAPWQSHPLPSLSKNDAVALSVVRSRVCGNWVIKVSDPSNPLGSGQAVPQIPPGQSASVLHGFPPLVPPSQPASDAPQVVVFTGMLTIALPVPPLAQVSAVPSPTWMSMPPELSTLTWPDPPQVITPPPPHVWPAAQDPDVKLVSPFSVVVKSEPPLESITPMPQPCCFTWVV